MTPDERKKFEYPGKNDGQAGSPATPERPGTDADQPANADYDYRPDFGQTGGGAEHNPEVKDNLDDTQPSIATRLAREKKANG